MNEAIWIAFLLLLSTCGINVNSEDVPQQEITNEN